MYKDNFKLMQMVNSNEIMAPFCRDFAGVMKNAPLGNIRIGYYAFMNKRWSFTTFTKF